MVEELRGKDENRRPVNGLYSWFVTVPVRPVHRLKVVKSNCYYETANTTVENGCANIFEETKFSRAPAFVQRSLASWTINDVQQRPQQ